MRKNRTNEHVKGRNAKHAIPNVMAEGMSNLMAKESTTGSTAMDPADEGAGIDELADAEEATDTAGVEDVADSDEVLHIEIEDLAV